MTELEYHDEVEFAVPAIKALYKIIRTRGFDTKSTKQIIEASIKCAIVDELTSNDTSNGDSVAAVEDSYQAEWIEAPCGFDIKYSDNYRCSKCGNTEKLCTRFCANCGRSMKNRKGFYWKN